MKKPHRLLYALVLSLALGGCVFDDLSHCPVDSTGFLSLSLSYASDTEEEGRTLPLERADFYVFDSHNLFVCPLSDTSGPFTAEREYRLELPQGSYTVVSWANLHERLSVSPEPFIPVQTTLDEARLRLAAIPLPAETQTRALATNSGTAVSAAADNIGELPKVDGVDKFLYHGMVQSVRVHTGQTARAVIRLKRDTKTINLSVRYTRADGTPCDDPSHHPDACIRTADGILEFDNSLSPCPPFLLGSAQRDDNIPNGFDAAFHKMTLRIDEPVEPEIILAGPGNPDNPANTDNPANKTEAPAPAETVYRASLMKWLKGTGYDTQEKLDATHEYLVELRFTCPHGGGSTHTTLRIFVNGWEYVPMEDDL